LMAYRFEIGRKVSSETGHEALEQANRCELEGY